MPFEFKDQHDFDLHIALEVSMDTLQTMFSKGKAAGMQVRGVSDHHFIQSIYFRDPNGYVIELTWPGCPAMMRRWTRPPTARAPSSTSGLPPGAKRARVPLRGRIDDYCYPHAGVS